MRKTIKHKVYTTEGKMKILLPYLDHHLSPSQIVREYKNKKIQDGITNRMTEEESIAAANRVYEKLSTYAIDVENQETNSTALPIEKVPANKDLTIYPSSESWYYIKNHKVYAYINFTGLTDDYEFCYNGSIEKMKRGKCSWEML